MKSIRPGQLVRTVTMLLIVLSLPACRKGQVKTSTNREFALTGTEIWDLGGNMQTVQGTAVLRLGDGSTMLVVKVTCDFVPGKSHAPLAEQIAQYALEHGYCEKARNFPIDGKMAPFSGGIGVALLHREQTGPAAVDKGYRFNFREEDLATGPADSDNALGD